MISKIEKLARTYARDDDCLVLVVITTMDDIENQSAALIAKECDKDKTRTVGVLTKADILALRSDEEQELWRKIVQNRTYPLKHGYYVTRLCNSDELKNDLSWEEIRRKERDFFSSRGAWSSVPKTRLGTENLTEALSALLENMIAKRLPKLRGSLYGTRENLVRQINELPQCFEDHPQNKLWQLCNDFIREFRHFATGQPKHFEFTEEFCKQAYRLKEQIEGTKPHCLAGLGEGSEGG